MSNQTIRRKKHTGEPGNPGHFGSGARAGSGMSLGAGVEVGTWGRDDFSRRPVRVVSPTGGGEFVARIEKREGMFLVGVQRDGGLYLVPELDGGRNRHESEDDAVAQAVELVERLNG